MHALVPLLALLLPQSEAGHPRGPELAPAFEQPYRLEARAVLLGGTQYLPPNGYLSFGPQQLQGVSAAVELPNGNLLALLDNGNGALENSRACLLSLQELECGPAGLRWVRSLPLRDPRQALPFGIVHQQDPQRPLTGADLDPESLVRLEDGTLWIGEEFGPFLLHFSAQGELLEAPIEFALLNLEGSDPNPSAAPGLDPTGAAWTRLLGSAGASLSDAPSAGAAGVSTAASEGYRPLRSPQHPARASAALLRRLSALDVSARARGGGPVGLSPSHKLLLDGAQPRELIDRASLRIAGFELRPWTVNSEEQIDALLKLGLPGLISDDPLLLLGRLAAFDGDQDGQPGDLLLPDGRVNPGRFDLQGHRGARAWRPENSLPALELALDVGVTTIELDCGLTSDLELLLSHDPDLPAGALHRLEPASTDLSCPVQALSLEEIQSEWRADRLDPAFTRQSNALDGSPVAVAFAAARGWSSPYTPASLVDAALFVEFYQRWYGTGLGRLEPQAQRRALVAQTVKFNLELKTSPERDSVEKLELWLKALESSLQRASAALDLRSRINLQSFDLRLLEQSRGLPIHWLIAPELLPGAAAVSVDRSPRFRPLALLGDWPWPFEGTGRSEPQVEQPPAAELKASAGFEGLAYDPTGPRLLALLEKPLAKSTAYELLLVGLPLGQSAAGPAGPAGPAELWRYPLSPEATSIGDIQWLGEGRLLVLERDDSEGRLDGWKRLFVAQLGEPGTLLQKAPLLDLLRLPFPIGWRGQALLTEQLFALAEPGDVGLPPRAAEAASGPSTFALPYITIETALPLADGRLLIINDNNFPGSIGRHQGSQRPDDTEFVWLTRSQP